MLKRVAMLLLVLGLASGGVGGIDLYDLENVVRHHSEKLCKTKCMEPVTARKCPDGSVWVANVAMFGCCGACVAFVRDNTTVCTGEVESLRCGKVSGGELECSELGEHFQTSLLDQSMSEENPNTLHSSWCGYGMYCNANETCHYNTSLPVECSVMLQGYTEDEASMNYRDDYRWKPRCAPDLSFAPKQCKGSSFDDALVCLCVDPHGDPLEGKAFDFEGELYDNMDCLCSRKVYELAQKGVESTLHCATNGNFEPLQCHAGWCFCVHSNGTVYGPQMAQKLIKLLPCHNTTTAGDQYLRQCDSQVYAHNLIKGQMKQKGVIGFPQAPASCQLEGSYSYRQFHDQGFVCKNKYNIDCNSKGDKGCDCVQDHLVYSAYSKNAISLQCDGDHGAYKPFQTIGGRGGGFKVDSHGVRQSPVINSVCEAFLNDTYLQDCQAFGNSLSPTPFCEKACGIQLFDLECLEKIYLYSPNYDPNYNSDVNDLKPCVKT